MKAQRKEKLQKGPWDHHRKELKIYFEKLLALFGGPFYEINHSLKVFFDRFFHIERVCSECGMQRVVSGTEGIATQQYQIPIH